MINYDDFLKRMALVPEVSDDEVIGAIQSVPTHYGADSHIDLGATGLFVNSISAQGVAQSGAAGVGLSGAVVGQWVDMSNSDAMCNVYVAVGPTSGPIGIAIQTAPGPYDIPLAANAFSGVIFSGGAPASGSFSDPTSGLAQLPSWVSSGGILWINSGLFTTPGILGASGQPIGGYPQGSLPFGPTPVNQAQGGAGFVASGLIPEMCSGGLALAAFQRNYQYCRLVWLSGATPTSYLQGGFYSQLMTIGSGGGQSQQPLPTNAVNV